jgi:hypothetical protein
MCNPYPTNSNWTGKRYDDPSNFLRGGLILGESTYGEVPARDPQWIWYFINKEAGDNWKYIDRTFGRLHRFMSGKDVSFIKLYKSTSSDDLESWFNLFAFTNFVAPSVSANASGASQSQLKDAGRIFLGRLSVLYPKPKGVWVMGEAQTCVSHAVLRELGIPSENIEVMKPHPAYISNVDGVKSWERFLAIMRRVNGNGD